MDKIKVSQAIIVEGKYDKIKLSSFIDGVILCTNGFQIYSNKQAVKLIRMYAQKSGVIILTDSDYAGYQIRGHLKSIIPEGKIINLYIPQILGKEKRKAEPSKEGTLGVEGINIAILRELFEKAGVFGDSQSNLREITKMDFFEKGLSGSPNSSELRKKLCHKLNLPVTLSANALRDSVNTICSYEEFIKLTDEILLEDNNG